MRWEKWSLVLVFAFVLSIFLVACGGGSEDDEANQSNNDDSTETEDTSNEEEDEGSEEEGVDEGESEQVLNININAEPPSLHPGKSSDTTSSSVLDQVFEGLTRINQDTGEAEEAMAEKIDVSDDGLTYTFTIREGATWTNGDPVTAHDFEYAWKWVLDPENPDTDYSYQLYPIKGAEAADTEEGSLDDVGITVEDDYTLVVELEQPTDYFLDLTAFHTFYPLNQNVVEENDEWDLDAGPEYVTNGPFKLVSWEHKDKIVIEKNEDYWDAGTVQLETINMLMIDKEATEYKCLKMVTWIGREVQQDQFH